LTKLVGYLSLQDIQHHLDNPWATRVWTIQEHAMAVQPVVMCGTNKASWKLFFDFSSAAADLLSNVSQVNDQMAIMKKRDLWRCRNLVTLLLSNAEIEYENSEVGSAAKLKLLMMSAYLSQVNSCSDPLDKVYSLYGILSDHFAQLPVVDYKRDRSELYAAFTRATMQGTLKFWPASSHQWKSNPLSELPSWVPDLMSTHYDEIGFHCLPDRLPDDDSEIGANNATLASKISSDLLSCSDSGLITLKGIQFSTIEVSDKRWPTFHAATWKRVFCLVSWIMFCLNLSTSSIPYPQQNGNLLALRTIFDAVLHEGRAKRRAGFLACLQWFEKEAQAFQMVDPNAWEDSEALIKRASTLLRDTLRSAFISTSLSISGSILFLTTTGHIGVTIGDVERGDTIALLSGSQRPIVIRRQQNGQWRCVASAYVAGIMQGEAWPKDKSVDELDTFVLA
jgi:hypothetical protein